MPWLIKEENNEYCVHKIGSDAPVPGGCHADRADAVKHMKALYANEPNAMKYSVLAFTDGLLTDTEDPNVKWIQAWRYSSWEHPKYGTVDITPEKGLQFKQHFDAKTLGRDHLINYEHGEDGAKGYKAAGSILDIDPRDDGIFYKVQFTDNALKEIRAGEWKYVSPEFDDYYLNRETGEVFENVPFDLALTNKPFFKGMPPLNFSEIYTEGDVEIVPSKSKGGSKVDEVLKKFAEKLGISLEDDSSEESILAAAEEFNQITEPLRKAKQDGERNRTFREAFPDEYKEMKKLQETRIEQDALSFSENYSRFTIRNEGGEEFKSVYGFSQVVKEKVADVHKKFSDRTVTHKDLKALLDLIGDKGIVDFSERGSSRTDSTRDFSDDPRLAFSEAVQDVMEKDNLEYEQALRMAATKYPKLYDEYVAAIPQR